MIKGLKRLNAVITKQLVPFGISKAICADDFSYGYESEDIHYKLTYTIEDEWFMQFIEETFDYIPINPFIMSILHEVGHHNTYDDIDDEDIEFCDNEKERINEQIAFADAERTKALEWEYFNLPDEIVATEWAVEYAKDHKEELETMWAEIKKAILEFYERNGVINDD